MEKVRKLLLDYPSNKVDVFIAYLKKLEVEKNKEGNLKNYWFTSIKASEFVDAFKKVLSTGLFIDGDSVTLTFRKQLVITYDYHAYQNKILITYPETKFDFDIVYTDDKISFKKESGKVIYTHEKGDPFDTNKKIKGAYGIIKNAKGEFLETLDLKDIEKMRNSSKMQSIWNNWFDRMVLKSVIKRVCAVHFKDLTKDMDNIDNEQNDPDMANIAVKLQEQISNGQTTKELTEIYDNNVEEVPNKNGLLKILKERKAELEGFKIKFGSIVQKLDKDIAPEFILRAQVEEEKGEDTPEFYNSLIKEIQAL